jgi:hypothetical protein
VTKQDYTVIAEVIFRERTAQATTYAQARVLDRVAVRMANALADENPRFDRDRFIDACMGAA